MTYEELLDLAHPGDYAGVTRNASYYIALLKARDGSDQAAR